MKPESSKSTVFRTKTEGNEARRNSVKDYLTNEQLIDVRKFIINKGNLKKIIDCHYNFA
jgi:hypothetical protein